MHSQGFGIEKGDMIENGRIQSDMWLDSYQVAFGIGKLPIGIKRAIFGIKKDGRRCIELPPNIGFETSDWQPGPTTHRGKALLANYQSILRENGSTQPPYPAPTIWNIEVLGG